MNERLTWPGNHNWYLLLTLALAVFAIAPLAYPGYVQVHTGFVPVYNLAELGSRGLDLGWKPSLATVFDPLRGDGLLPYYVGLPFVWLGWTALTGVKIVFALSLVLGAAGVYVWLRPSLGPGGAALGALVYTYLPYHLAVVYVRGAWGEALFLGLLPWALAAANTSRKSPQTTEVLWLALTMLVWALLGLSQAGLTLWAFLLLVVWSLWVEHGGRRDALGGRDGQPGGGRKGRPYLALFAALGGGIVGLTLTLLSADFNLPPSPIDLYQHFLFPAQLLSAYWGFGASRPGWDDGMALGLGLAATGLAMLSLILAGSRRRTQAIEPGQSPVLPRLLRVLVLALALTLLLLGPTALLWRLTGLSYTLTYPWQLLGLIGLLLSVLAGSSVSLDRRLAALPAYAGLIILTLLASYSYLEPRFTGFQPGMEPLAAWDQNRLMLLDHELSVEIPPAAAGLYESTPGQLLLVDYGAPRPGDTLHLTLTWQATLPFYRDLKLFVHLIDPSGQVIAQADPLAGLGAGPEGEDYFTSHWAPGELIADDVTVSIPSDAPPGPYRLALGLYDADTLERLPVVGREDGSVILGVRSWE